MSSPLEKNASPEGFGAYDPYALVGEIVAGRFRVLALKHAGPRAVVYEVEPPGVGQMRRALKVTTVSEAREPDVAERLRTVVRAMREADHPFVERVYDVGFLPDESPFVIAEWLPQLSLERLLEGRRRLSPALAMEILLRIVRGCASLHQRGVVHGDLRPNHVLVDVMGDEPADLRVVKVTDAGVPGVLNMGLVGGATGQVAYMAPECLTGQARSPASDVYALGVLAYRIITERLPYRSDDTRARAEDRDPVSRVRWLHLNASPVRPSKLVGTADFSPAVEAVVGRAMAKSLVERFPDANAMLAALESALVAPIVGGPADSQHLGSEALLTESTVPEAAEHDQSASGSAEAGTPEVAATDSGPTGSPPSSVDDFVASPPDAAVSGRLFGSMWVWAAAGAVFGCGLALL